MGLLERHLDDEAIARVKAGIRYKHEPIKHKTNPRSGDTYRGARRNAILRGFPKSVWAGIKPTLHAHWPRVRLNRSAKWPEKNLYSEPNR